VECGPAPYINAQAVDRTRDDQHMRVKETYRASVLTRDIDIGFLSVRVSNADIVSK